MGIRLLCPNGHKLHVKSFLAGKRGICPQCGATFIIPQPTDPESATADSVIVTTPAPPAVDPIAPPAPAPEPLASSPPAPPPAAPPPTAAPPPPSGPPIPLPPAEFLGPQKALDDVAADDADDATPDAAGADVVAKGRALNYRLHRSRVRRSQVALTIWLIATVIALAVLLIWVLTRGSGQPSAAGQEPRSDLAKMARRPYVAATESASPWESSPRLTTG